MIITSKRQQQAWQFEQVTSGVVISLIGIVMQILIGGNEGIVREIHSQVTWV